MIMHQNTSLGMETYQNSPLYQEDFVEEGLEQEMKFPHLAELLPSQMQVVWR